MISARLDEVTVGTEYNALGNQVEQEITIKLRAYGRAVDQADRDRLHALVGGLVNVDMIGADVARVGTLFADKRLADYPANQLDQPES